MTEYLLLLFAILIIPPITLFVIVGKVFNYVHLISEMNVYHNLSIENPDLFKALRDKDVVPSSELVSNKLRNVMFFVSLLCIELTCISYFVLNKLGVL